MTIQPNPAPITVLIADDDARLVTALARRLRGSGFHVIECQDAYMAIELARRHKPDVILLDVNMPAGGGESTHARLAKIGETASIPIIYLTGDDSERVRRRAHDLGAFAVIGKPFDMEDLLSHILEASRRAAA